MTTDQSAPNRVICPTCGEVRLETPEGTRALPTFGVALKASRRAAPQATSQSGSAAGTCDCGRRHLDEHGQPREPRDG